MSRTVRGRSRQTLCIVAILVLAMAVGCASSGKGADDGDAVVESNPERARYSNLSTDGLEIEKVDLYGNDRPDQWIFSDSDGNIVRIERDMNFNGQVDMWQYFDSAGELIEEEMVLDTSGGQVDVVAFYRNGQVHRKLMGIGFDGTFPIEKFYDNQGKLLRVERDSTADGKVDVWEYYDDGRRSRIGWDTTYDGQPDTFDQF